MRRKLYGFWSVHKEIIILCFLFLSLKSFYLLKPHLFGWDEAVYVGMGKYLYSFGAQGLWEDIRPIGLPLVIGGFWNISSILVEIMMNLFAAGSGVLIYFIARTMYDKRVGLISAILLFSAPLFFAHSSLIMTAIPSTFFVLLGLYFYVMKKHPLLIGCVLGVGSLFRFPQGIALVAVVLLLLFEKKFRDVTMLCAGFFIPFCAFFAFNYVMYYEITGSITDALLRPLIFGSQHQLNPLYPENMWFYFNELFFQNFLFVFAFVGGIFSFKRKNYPLIVLLVLYFFYFTYIPNKQDRFLLVFLPYVVVFSAVGLTNTLNKVKKNIVMLIFMMLIIIVSFVVVAQQNVQDYEWRSNEEHEMVDFFAQLNHVVGPILTTTPLPVVYTDQAYISFYDNPTVGLEIYQKFREVPTVVYAPQFFPCTNNICAMEKKLLFDEINKRRLITNATFGDYNYLIFT